VQHRILLGQLGSYGDCLFATTIARQIKADYPGCHLTWAVAAKYRSILDCNPDVDEVWELPLATQQGPYQGWEEFQAEALRRKARGEYSEVFLTQLNPANMHHFDGTIRSSIFRGYPRKITVPLAPVLRLRHGEVENVRRFAEENRLPDAEDVVLFECAPKSRQSFVSAEMALGIARGVVSSLPETRFVLSSDGPLHSGDPRIVDGSALTFRENAELTKYCSLLVGCSSGISWLATSGWAKPLPMIQVLTADAEIPNSFALDFARHHLPAENLIEMGDCPASEVRSCIESVLTRGPRAAKPRFHRPIPASFGWFSTIYDGLLTRREYGKALRFVKTNAGRYGFDPELVRRALRPLPSTLRKALFDRLHRLRVALHLPRVLHRR